MCLLDCVCLDQCPCHVLDMSWTCPGTVLDMSRSCPVLAFLFLDMSWSCPVLAFPGRLRRPLILHQFACAKLRRSSKLGQFACSKLGRLACNCNFARLAAVLPFHCLLRRCAIRTTAVISIASARVHSIFTAAHSCRSTVSSHSGLILSSSFSVGRSLYDGAAMGRCVVHQNCVQ